MIMIIYNCIYIFIHIHIYICIYICTYVYTYIYTYIARTACLAWAASRIKVFRVVHQSVVCISAHAHTHDDTRHNKQKVPCTHEPSPTKGPLHTHT